MKKSEPLNKSDKKKLVEVAWKKEVKAIVKAHSEGKIKTISHSKIKKGIKLKFNPLNLIYPNFKSLILLSLISIAGVCLPPNNN